MRLAHRHPRPTGVATAPSRGMRGEEGETLIEIMATVVLMGTAIVAILAGLFTAVVTSDLHKRQTRAANEATNSAEAIQRATYLPCTSGTPNYSSSLPSLPSGYVATITNLQYLASSATADPTWTSTCPGTDQGAQRMTITVTQGFSGRKVVESIVYMKRNTRCSATVATGC